MAAHEPRSPGHEAKAIAGFLAAEGVPTDGRILDVPCGIGRRAVGLAQEGFRVTAVDANEIGVETARARAPPEFRERLRFVCADKAVLPGLPTDERFDGILCLDHPIGRDGPEADRTFLERLASHTSPEGVLVLELLHRDFFAIHPKSFSFHILANVEEHELRAFDPVTGVLGLTWKFYHRDGEDLRHRGQARAELRLLAPHEAIRALESAGWRVSGTFGGWGREPLGADRRKLVLVARRRPVPS